MKRLSELALLFGALIFLLAACGGDSTDTENVAASSANDAADNGATDDDVASSDADSDAEATADGSGAGSVASGGESLDEILGVAANIVRGGGAGGGPGGALPAGFDETEALEQQRLVQQEIQVCMQRQGFEYTAEEVGVGFRFAAAGSTSGLSPQEYAETEGFGVTTAFDAILEGDIDFDEEETNPNDEHLETLSEGAADAWQLALQGEAPQRNADGQLIDPETGEVIQGGRGRGGFAGGCTGEAQTAVRGDFEQLGELADLFVEVEDRIAADPRIAEIEREWTTCMSAAGFDYTNEAEARADLNDQFRPLLFSFFGRGAAGGGAGNAGGGDAGNAGGNAGGAGNAGGNRLQAISGLELTAEQDAELNALQDLERSIAVASLTCQGDTGEEADEIRLGYEAEFIEANRTILASFGS